jgi:transmembrane sensor
MIPSEEIIILLNKLWSEESLEPDEVHRLESWRVQPNASDSEAALFKTWRAAESYSADFAPDTDVAWEQLSARIEADKKLKSEKIKPANRRRRIWIAAAASLLGLIFYTWLSWPRQQEFSIRTVSATETAPMEIALSDGSWIALQRGSTLSWPEPFEKAPQRAVQLSGQAYFKVKSDSLRPFRVVSDFGFAEVLGTAFNAIAVPGSGGMEITVEEGKVRLAGAHESVELEAGQRGVLRLDGGISTASDQSGNAFSWFRGELKFRNAPLQEVLEAVSRHYGIQIKPGSESMKRCSYTGKFVEVPLAEVIATLELIFGSKVEMTSEGHYKMRGGSCAR